MINILQVAEYAPADTPVEGFIGIIILFIFVIFVIVIGLLLKDVKITESKDRNKNISSSFTIDDDGTIIRDFSKNSSYDYKAVNYCYKCGSRLDIKSNFCPNCGAPLS